MIGRTERLARHHRDPRLAKQVLGQIATAAERRLTTTIYLVYTGKYVYFESIYGTV